MKSAAYVIPLPSEVVATPRFPEYQRLTGVASDPSHGTLRAAAPYLQEEVIAHELGHCLVFARTAQSTTVGGVPVQLPNFPKELNEAIADITAYNHAYREEEIVDIPDRVLYPDPLPQADDLACAGAGDPHLTGQILVAAYGLIVKRLDPLPRSMHVSAQQLFFRALQAHADSSSTLATMRGAFVAAAIDLRPAGLPGAAEVRRAVEAAFDAVGLVDGWARRTDCPAP